MCILVPRMSSASLLCQDWHKRGEATSRALPYTTCQLPILAIFSSQMAPHNGRQPPLFYCVSYITGTVPGLMAFCCYGKTFFDTKQLGKKRLTLLDPSPSLREVSRDHRGTQLIQLLLLTTQAHLLRASTVHSELGPPSSTRNEEMSPQTHLQASLLW